MTDEKRCTVCKQVKALQDFRTYRGRGSFGRRPLCKVCQRQYEMKWRSSSKEYRKAARARRRGKDAAYRLQWISKNRAKYLIAEIRRRSARESIPFDLNLWTTEIDARIKKGLCEVTGYPLDLKARFGRNPLVPSLDRIDPKGGYVYKNIRVTCWAVNAMLSDWGEEAVLPIIKAWARK